MTPKEHLDLARAEYDEANRQLTQQMYTTPDQRLLLAQTEALLALTVTQVTLTRKRWWQRLRA